MYVREEFEITADVAIESESDGQPHTDIMPDAYRWMCIGRDGLDSVLRSIRITREEHGVHTIRLIRISRRTITTSDWEEFKHADADA
jgi:hypothetical protein